MKLTSKSRKQVVRYRLLLTALFTLLLVMLVGIAGARFVTGRQQRATVELVMRMDGWCGYDYEKDNGGAGDSRYPVWFTKYVGQDTLHRVVRVHFPNYADHDRFGDLTLTNERLVCLKELPNLRFLGIYLPQITDEAIVHLAAMERLEYLNIWGTSISEAGVEQLQSALPNTTVTRERPSY